MKEKEQKRTEDRIETQRFAVHNILVSHCDQMLTPDKVDEITEELTREMTVGPCSWAFKLSLLFLAFSLHPLAFATIVRFDDIDRDPTSITLNIGGVDIIGEDLEVSTKAGIGVGYGLDSLIGSTIYYEPESGLVWWQYIRGISFVAPGPITAITIAPFDYPVLPTLAHPWEFRVSTVISANPNEGFVIGALTSTSGAFDGEDHGWQNIQSFTWGFSIASLEYSEVPEPRADILLLVGGLLGFAWLRARKGTL